LGNPSGAGHIPAEPLRMPAHFLLSAQVVCMPSVTSSSGMRRAW
jgi:hypothetical protein